MNKSRGAFRTISEVSDWLETPAHVLRFWESKFSQIRPVKGAGGRRYYRPEDMALLGGIKFLLHEQGLTIKGAQKLLREQGLRYVASLGPQPFGDEDSAAPTAPLHAVIAPQAMSAASVAPAYEAPALPVDSVDAHDITLEQPPSAPAAVAAASTESAPIGAEILPAAAQMEESGPLAQAHEQQDFAPDAENHAISATETANAESLFIAAAPESPAIQGGENADSAPRSEMTLRRPINEILIHTLMMGDRGHVGHRESLTALALRLHDARARISIE